MPTGLQGFGICESERPSTNFADAGRSKPHRRWPSDVLSGWT